MNQHTQTTHAPQGLFSEHGERPRGSWVAVSLSEGMEWDGLEENQLPRYVSIKLDKTRRRF
jgi:hypothetical protein